MSSPDLEALVTSKIRDAIQAALAKVGRKDFLEIAGIRDESLEKILENEGEYVNVALVTLACQINKSHDDSDPAHSSISECLKGTIIRIPQTTRSTHEEPTRPLTSKKTIRKLAKYTASGSLYDKKSLRLLAFSANTFAFLALGYFLGGIGLSPILGQSSCTGVSFSPPSLAPCAGSILGIIISAIGGLVYTYYYFVKKM